MQYKTTLCSGKLNHAVQNNTVQNKTSQYSKTKKRADSNQASLRLKGMLVRKYVAVETSLNQLHPVVI